MNYRMQLIENAHETRDQWYRKQQVNPEECSDLNSPFSRDRGKAEAEAGCCRLTKGQYRMFEAEARHAVRNKC